MNASYFRMDTIYNESTAGADASVEALTLCDMKLLTLALAYSNT